MPFKSKSDDDFYKETRNKKIKRKKEEINKKVEETIKRLEVSLLNADKENAKAREIWANGQKLFTQKRKKKSVVKANSLGSSRYKKSPKKNSLRKSNSLSKQKDHKPYSLDNISSHSTPDDMDTRFLLAKKGIELEKFKTFRKTGHDSPNFHEMDVNDDIFVEVGTPEK